MNYESEFKDYLYGTELYEFTKCPNETDLFIIGDNDFKQIVPYWKKYLSELESIHPNNYIEYRYGTCKHIDEENIDVFLEITISERFHGINKTLHKDDYIFCFQCKYWDERTYIVVSQEWFDSIKNDNYSCYGMIDIIGIRKMLKDKGKIPKTIIDDYCKKVNEFASKNKDFLFISFTDNLFIKTNWTSFGIDYNKTYNPEKIILLIEELMNIIKDTFGLNSYAILTQGLHLIENDEKLFRNEQENHFFVGSISTPFVEMFDIENKIFKIKENDKSILKSLYLSKSFFLSLNFKKFESKMEFNKKFIEYDSKVSIYNLNEFLPVDIDNLTTIINCSD